MARSVGFVSWSGMGACDFSLSSGGFGTGFPGNRACEYVCICVWGRGGRKECRGEVGGRSVRRRNPYVNFYTDL